MTPTALRLAGGISAYLAPRLATDQRLPPIAPMVSDINRRNLGAKKDQLASRIRYQMRGRIAQDADLDDLLDLLDALEEIGESEEMEGGEDRYRRRGRDQEPNDPFGSGGYENGGSANYGVNPDLYNDEDPGCSDPGHGLDEEEEYPPWKEADAEERRRLAVANSTGSEAIDRRIAMNRDRARKAGDQRRAVIDRMRRIVRDALSGSDQPPYFEDMPPLGSGSRQSNVLDPDAPEIDRRETGAGDRRRVVGDSASNSRSRMLANMRRISDTGTSYCPTTAGGSSPGFGSGSSAAFQARHPWAARIKIG